MLHGRGQAYEFNCNVYAFSAGCIQDLLDWIAGSRIDRDGAERGSRREFGGIDFDNIDLAAVEGSRQLERRKSQAAEPENRDGLTGFKACFVQGMQRSRRRTHHDCAMLE